MIDLEGECVIRYSHTSLALMLMVAGLAVPAPAQAPAQALGGTRAGHWVELGAHEPTLAAKSVVASVPVVWSSRGTGTAALRGGIIGMLVGGAVGFVVGQASCQRCDESAPVLAATGVGALVGGVIGLYVGAARASPAASRSPSSASSAWTRPNGAFQLPASSAGIPGLDSLSHTRHHPAWTGRS